MTLTRPWRAGLLGLALALSACDPPPDAVSVDDPASLDRDEDTGAATTASTAPTTTTSGTTTVSTAPTETSSVIQTLDEGMVARAQSADAVFAGTVVAIEYRESDPGEFGSTYPFTFVTWRVEKAFKGAVAGTELTGRFLGGPTDDGSRILRVSGSTDFDLGDTDVLFLKDNGYAGMPLVDGDRGRVRVSGGKVYVDDGYGLTLGDGKLLTRGGWFDLPERKDTTVGSVVFHDHASPVEPEKGADGMAAETFYAWLAAQLPEGDRAPIVASASPKDKFTLELMP